MIIDLSDLIRNPDEKIVLDNDIEIENTEFMGESFTFINPLHINGEITNNTKSLEFRAHVEGKMGVQCARCRKDMTVPISFDISEVIMQDTVADPEEDVIIIDNEKLDIHDIVLNNFLMNVEGRYLCSDDCKGLCPKCGADLNMGDCGCGQEDIDPRWAKLAEIIKNSADTK